MEKEKTIKFNSQKTMIGLIPAVANMKGAEPYTHGVSKYSKNNCLAGRDWSDLYDGMLRHLSAWKNGEDIVPDQGTLHLAAARFAIDILIYYLIEGKGTDDRIKSKHIDPMFQLQPGNYEQIKWQENLYKAICKEVKELKDAGAPISDPEFLQNAIDKVNEVFRKIKPEDI